MKLTTIILSIAFLATSFIATASPTDSLSASADGKEKMKIVKGDVINIDHSGISVNLHSEKKWSIVMEGLGIGLNSAGGQPADAHLEWGKSFDITWLYALGIKYTKGISSITFGVGFDWKNFKMTKRSLRMAQSSGCGVTLEGYPEGVIPKNSTLKIFSISFPLLYQVRVPYLNTDLSIGPILNVSPHSSVKTSYINENGNETTEGISHIGQRKLSLDIFGALTYSEFGIYLRCSTGKALHSASPLNFTPLTLGIMLFL